MKNPFEFDKFIDNVRAQR